MSSPVTENTVAVWDPLVRLLHWSLVACVAIAFVTEDEVMTLHRIAGYAVLAIVAARVVWGLVGSRHARFGDFVRPPAEAVAYLRSLATRHHARHLGHNPAGGLMIVALLVMLALVGWSGWMADGPGAAKAFEELHEGLANGLLFLVVIHVAGVVLGSLADGENLVRAMITGRKRAG